MAPRLQLRSARVVISTLYISVAILGFHEKLIFLGFRV